MRSLNRAPAISPSGAEPSTGSVESLGDVVKPGGRRDPARVEVRDHRAGRTANDHPLGGEHLDQSRKVLTQDDLLEWPAQVDADRGLGEMLAGHVEEHAEPLDEGLVIPLDEIEPAPRRGRIPRIVELEAGELRSPRRVQSVDACRTSFQPSGESAACASGSPAHQPMCVCATGNAWLALPAG